MIVVVDGLNGREFSSFDLVHQFPRASTFVRYFFDFVIKKGSLGVLTVFLNFFQFSILLDDL